MEKYLTKYASSSLVVFPILACYNIGETALYKYLMLFSCVIFLFIGKKHKKLFMPSSLIIFYGYIFTIPIIIALSYGALTNFLGSFLTPLLFGMNLLLMVPYLEIDYIIKYYRIIVLFASAVFLMQEYMYYTTGYRFGALIPFLDLYNGVPASEYMGHLKYANRSCSFFVEPSHFAQFLAPFLALELNNLNRKGKLFNIITIVISLILVILRSGNGLFLLAVIWIAAFLFSQMSRMKKVFFVLPLSFVVLFYWYGIFAGTEEGQQVLERTEQLELEQERVSSGIIRLYRGFFVFKDMPLTIQLFGVGAGGSDYMIDKSSYNWMFSRHDHYLNNSSFFLIAFGYIGTFLFLLFLFDILMRKQFGSTVLVFAFITLSLMESFVFDPRMLLYIGLASMVLLPKSSVRI